MATLAQLRLTVSRIITDASYDDDVITEYLNSALVDIAGGVSVIWPKGDHTISSPLPDLYTIGTVTTDTTDPYVALPAGYQREVVFVASSGGYEVTFYSNFGDFRRSAPLLDMSGSVVFASVKASNLYYQGIPAAASTLTVHYHAAPSTMSAVGDIPEGLPSRFHNTLLVNMACLRIFNEIYEEDSSGHAVIGIYESKINKDLINLESSIDRDAGSVIFKSAN